jgi:hypothetical protein
MRNSKYLGGVRELSYDAQYARPNGQTKSQIKADAVGAKARHVALPDRYYLLRFLGLDACRHLAANIGQQS